MWVARLVRAGRIGYCPGMDLTLVVKGNLRELLGRRHPGAASVCYPLERRASIKDILESLGIPHPEIGALLQGGRHLDFSHIPAPGETITVLPLETGFDVTRPTVLRPEPLAAERFLVDANVARLAGFLRMLGFDCTADEGLGDAELARRSRDEGRILLTRDRRLLQRRLVLFGHLVRAAEPDRQLLEVVRLFGLQGRTRPFVRCMACNGLLRQVAKDVVLHRLEPLTRKYYEEFMICAACGKVYWAGSHRGQMERKLEILRAKWQNSGPAEKEDEE